MNQDDFKKLLEDAIEPIKKQLGNPDTGLAALNKRLDVNTGAVIELESTVRAYADMYKVNNSNSKKLEKRIEVLEDKSSVIPPPELTLADVS